MLPLSAQRYEHDNQGGYHLDYEECSSSTDDCADHGAPCCDPSAPVCGTISGGVAISAIGLAIAAVAGAVAVIVTSDSGNSGTLSPSNGAVSLHS